MYFAKPANASVRHHIVMTNKEGALLPKRKPGAGRKPLGPIAGKLASFSTRITVETRTALEAEAASSGKSISQVAELLLRDAIAERRNRKLDDPLRALSFLIGEIAESCWSPAEDGTRCYWNTDPSIFEVFRIAVVALLEKLRPPGEIDTSLAGPLIGGTPQQKGEETFRKVWSSLQTVKSLTSQQVQQFFRTPMSTGDLADLSRMTHAWSDARRKLVRDEQPKPEKTEGDER